MHTPAVNAHRPEPSSPTSSARVFNEARSTFTPDADGWTIIADSESIDCEGSESLDFLRLAGHAYVDFGFSGVLEFGAVSLMRWDTSALPADAVIVGASLKAVVAGTFYNTDAASLTAEWFDWGGSCDATD